jgi:nucleoside-diphosphate-sugar epimerase
VGLSRVDVRDIAEAAAITLTGTGHEGQTYALVGPDVLTGKAVAEIWSRALGKSVVYAGDDLDTWEHLHRVMPSWMVFDLQLMYQFFQEQGLKAMPAEVERLTSLLGHPPRHFEDFARETAQAWMA